MFHDEIKSNTGHVMFPPSCSHETSKTNEFLVKIWRGWLDVMVRYSRANFQGRWHIGIKVAHRLIGSLVLEFNFARFHSQFVVIQKEIHNSWFFFFRLLKNKIKA